MTYANENTVDAWKDNCLNWDYVGNVLENSSRLNKDVYKSLGEIDLVVNEDTGKLAVQVNGQQWDYTGNSLSQMHAPHVTGLGTRLCRLGMDSIEEDLINRLYVHRWETYRKGQEHKSMFLRLREANNEWENGTVRAFLTGGYKPIDHRWIAEQFSRLRPDAMLRFDEGRFLDSGGDFCSLELLDPESMRHCVDGGYGRMTVVSNSEVGRGRFRMLPSIYRDICSNGLIFGIEREKGELFISMVHKGQFDAEKLIAEIESKIIKVESMQEDGLVLLEDLRAKSFEGDLGCLEGVLGLQCTLQVGKQFLKNSKKDQEQLLRSFQEEPLENAFGVLNAVTRFAQVDCDLSDQQDCEIVAGRLLNSWANEEKGVNAWKLLNRNAVSINVSKELGIAL